MPNPTVIFVIALLVGWLVLAPMIMPGATAIASVVFIALVLAVIAKVGKFPTFPASGKNLNYAIVGLAVVALAVGSFAPWGFSLGGLIPTASVTPTAGITTPSPSEVVGVTGLCAGKGITTDNLGDSATVTISLRDAENNNPQTQVDAGSLRAYANGVERTVSVTPTGGTFTGQIGQEFAVYGGNGTRYAEAKSGCIEGGAVTVEMVAHNATAAPGLAVTCYDSEGTALTAATNTTLHDYQITLGADQSSTFSCKVRVAGADTSFQLGAVATGAYNDIDDLELSAFREGVCQAGHTSCQGAGSVGFSEVVVPEFLKDTTITCTTSSGGCARYVNSTAQSNITGYDRAYELTTPVLLQEFDEVKYDFVIEAGSSDPSEDINAFATTDIGILCFLDKTWDQGADGKEYMTFYTRDANQDDVGVTEDYAVPTDLDACAVIVGA